MALCLSVRLRLSFTSRSSVKTAERMELVSAWELSSTYPILWCGSVAEWLACSWTQVQKGPGSDRSRDAVG